MNYIIFDLEFNRRVPGKPYEMIQIGAIKCDENFNAISCFDELIKPEIYITLHPFVQELTHISMEKLSQAKVFTEVYDEFINFIDDTNMNETILCSWGMIDIKILFSSMKYHQIDCSKMTQQYINLQHYVSKHFKYGGKSNIGLKTAVELLKIPQEKVFHDALADAYYTKEIFKRLYQHQKLPVSIYNHDQQPRNETGRKKKTKLDEETLYLQIEKMHNTKLSEQDKKMVKLAYLMGKSNQFQVEVKSD